MALQGSLSDFGIAEILQLIGTQQKTGILHVDAEAEDGVEIYFSSGRIIRSEVARRDKRDLLGSMLLAAEVIDRGQLNAALKEHKQSLKRVGDVLVERKIVSAELLREFTDLQTRETLYRLFEWKTGAYRFEGKPPNFARPVGTPISCESLLMEGFRLLDEWPLVRARVNNYDTVYGRIKDLEDAESEAEALERILDDAFSEFVDASQPAPRKRGATGAASNLGRPERRVLTLVDGKRSVHKIIDMSRLGEFETCKALVALINEGYIAPVRAKKARATPDRRRGGSWAQVALRGLVNVGALGAIVAAVLFMPQSRIELHRNSERVAMEAAARLRANRFVAVSNALDIYRVENGVYPDDLEALVEKGILDKHVLDVPGEPVEYVSVGDDYDLR